MAATSGPQSVTNGLVLHLDAANAKNSLLTAVEVLVVAGGGGGGGDLAGGGGGGGVLTGTISVTTQAYTVTVGNGGRGGIAGSSRNTENTRGGDGENSSVLGFTAIGGGGGGVYGASSSTLKNGRNGGSGGGAGSSEGANAGTSGLGILGQGNSGGLGLPNPYAGGGGGGAGAVGQDAPNAEQGGNGGSGVTSLITGSAVIYAGGGGGSDYRTIAGATPGSGGSGGGGNGGGSNGGTVTIVAQNGTVNTGGGGGGGAWQGSPTIGGAGGSGIVVIRYPGPQRATGGTVTQAGGDTVHTFTSVGNSTFTVLPALANAAAITNVSDLSGNGIFTTAVNNPVYSTDSGGVIQFNGVNNVVNTSTTIIDRTNGQEITVSCWIKPNRTSGQYSVFCTNRSDSASIYNWIFYQHVSDGAIAFHGIAQNKSAYIPTIGQWINVTNTVTSAGVSTLYVNSVSTYVVNGFTYGNGTPGRLGIGADPGGQEPFQGSMSAIHVFNRALTAAEVQQNFEAQRGRYGI